ncbi:hypothetical protein L593_09515 [Salinarchaeum sp. Harcht-Bsk1]|uniref:DUF5803 family protein n=1 Tax=Salinarchaeum sp. Harcht-Bsk1 TaxID=1333523 RepID=UPI0003423A4F|nr:DUF5803 family protein [Salinarchaeum sp. Harcht-Bsk1]AGN01848.1 hypothetical protein L593_09515 [Salinarchaeum sp. Harcht-Bsk1]
MSPSTSTRRRLLLLFGLVGLLALSGCIGQFGTGLSEGELSRNATYEWDTSATADEWPDDVTVQIEINQAGFLGDDTYHGIYTGNRTQVTFSERGFTRPHSLDIRAVKYQYPNGTVVGHEAIDVDQNARRTRVRLPEGPGRFAWIGDRRNKELRLPAIADGNYTVTLPRHHSVGDFLLSDVSPRSYNTRTVDGHTQIVWTGVDNSQTLLVRFYRDRDFYLFYGLIGLLTVVGAGIFLHYRREIQEIQEWRAAQGLDLDRDDDDGERPPPGMG